jgi:FSR family fosmidomycin resistance protein-like MFS transporter
MMDRRRLATLSAGHGAVDLCQGAVPALLPFPIVARGMSLASATALLTAATIGSSIVQPLFGLWADRLATPLLLPAGLALAGLGLGAVGWCDSYIMLALALFVSGLGTASPPASRSASRSASAA